MGSFRIFGKVFSCGKRSQHITLTVLVLVLTFSIVLAVPETSQKTRLQSALSEKTANSNGEVLLNKTFGGSGEDEGYCVVQSSDGGYIITGGTTSSGEGAYDVWLVKTNSIGDHEWNKTYGGTGHDTAKCVVQTSDGGYIITGKTSSFSLGFDDVWLIKTNSTGDHVWNQTYGGVDQDNGESVLQTSDGGYIIVGSTESFAVGSYDVWLIKTNSIGEHEWNQTFGGTDRDEGYCVAQTSDGGYIITGYKWISGTSRDVWLIKTDENGKHLWNQTFGGTGLDEGYCVAQTADGGYIITGYTTPVDAGIYSDVWLIKTDQNGNEEWNQTYGAELSDAGRCVQQTPDGGYIITGTAEFIPTAFTMSIRIWGADPNIWLIKTDENGNIMWDQTYGGTDYDEGWYISQTSDGEYIITGFTESYGADGSEDIWLLKVASGFPVIDQAADITYEEGSEGHNITWQTSDAEPSNYTITRNETLVESGSWDGGNITVNVDGLSVGVYLYTCTVNDTVGQYASDTVMVTVTEPEEDGGFPWSGFGLALALIGLVAVIIYYTQYAKKP